MLCFVSKNKFQILLLLTVCVLAFADETKAAVGQLGSPTFTTNTNTLSFTVPSGGNRILLVVASDDNALDIASVSFGASPMIQRAEHNDGTAVDSVWTLSLGTSFSSTTATITVVSTGTTPNNSSFIGAIAFHTVSQTTPISNVQMVNNTTIPSASTLNIVSAPGNMVFDVWDTFTNNLMPTNTVTPGGSQTVTHNAGTVTLATGGFGYYRTSTRPGAASVPMSWTTNNGVALIHIGLNINTTTTAARVSVSGRVTTADGRGIRNAIVTISDSNGNVRQTRTGSFGYYQFDEIEVGSTYVLEIAGKRYVFPNPTRTLVVTDELTNIDFIAEQY